ncbi:hypothetical protein [Verminephrobacter eiseniae]|uniref:hypothetical protein n=1 Tax=Verminephrobacter eiseniae TaxID=364317 RepID=UPI002243DFCA|nr:hypothetical protein [Verminephrobacter eiseniae]
MTAELGIPIRKAVFACPGWESKPRHVFAARTVVRCAATGNRQQATGNRQQAMGNGTGNAGRLGTTLGDRR